MALHDWFKAESMTVEQALYLTAGVALGGLPGTLYGMLIGDVTAWRISGLTIAAVGLWLLAKDFKEQRDRSRKEENRPKGVK